MVKEFLKAYKKAETLEKLRAKTYEGYANKIGFSAGKHALNFLVGEERKHLKFLKEQERRLTEGEKLALSKLKPGKYKPERKLITTRLGSLKSDIRILKSATKFELQDIVFYRKASQDSKKPESKKFFKAIQKMEQEHLNLLKKIIKRALEESAALSAVQDPRLMFAEMNE